MNQEAPRESFLTRANRAKNNTVLVGVVGGIVALAFFLAGLFTGAGTPGLGQKATQKDETKQPVDQQDPKKEEREVKPEPEAFSPGQQASKTVDHPGDVLFLRVVSSGYEVRSTKGEKSEYQPASLDQVVALARKADGDDKGIKVIWERNWDSTGEHESNLKKKLTDSVGDGGAGLDKNAIMEKEAF